MIIIVIITTIIEIIVTVVLSQVFVSSDIKVFEIFNYIQRVTLM